jgi:hypothetical protein
MGFAPIKQTTKLTNLDQCLSFLNANLRYPGVQNPRWKIPVAIMGLSLA